MKFMYGILFLAFSTFFTLPAHALFEARLTYGLLGSQPDLAPLFVGAPSSSLPNVAPTYGLGADLIISPPFFPIGIGMRYENMGLDAKSGGYQFKVSYTRTALLVNYRIIDTLMFLGPIFSYGLSHSGEMKANQNGVETGHYTSDSISSYGLGLEAGVKLIGFHLGAELGYQDFRWKDAKNSQNPAFSQDINMSGTYAKVLLGFGI